MPISTAETVPPLVRIILTQAIRRRANGGITPRTFAAQILRLEKEELNPKGLDLVSRELSGGRTRFIIKEATSGAVRDILEFAADGSIEPV
ncbi:MAG: hypothetical protein ABJF10_25555 [Chthoniobacter sp.]|uniref:hypothetical protein n=1 Tax=Chthoniobacter sp. TaxID=2510640 RepID=UPI0032AB438A